MSCGKDSCKKKKVASTFLGLYLCQQEIAALASTFHACGIF